MLRITELRVDRTEETENLTQSHQNSYVIKPAFTPFSEATNLRFTSKEIANKPELIICKKNLTILSYKNTKL